jgi:hypothetical protein
MKDSEREEVERLLATLRDGQARDEDLVPAVLDRIRASTTTIPPRKRPARRRRTAVVVAIASLGLAACAVIPPVREAVVALFRTNGILVRQGPVGPTPSATSATSGASTGSSRSVAAVSRRRRPAPRAAYCCRALSAGPTSSSAGGRLSRWATAGCTRGGS